MFKLINYITESYQEMVNKVTWPSYNSLQNSSVLVLVASLIFAMFIGVIDLGFENTMSLFYETF
ncbi:MAG: preprotein translocase subunit SecE [SAR202 cluster bacterium]|nr:preprotein translocase subunit SecE [SAR202 cluster bacterium]